MSLHVLSVSVPVPLTFVAKISGSDFDHDELHPDSIHGPQSFDIVLIAELILHKHGMQSVRHCRYLLKGQFKSSLNNWHCNFDEVKRFLNKV